MNPTVIAVVVIIVINMETGTLKDCSTFSVAIATIIVIAANL